MSGKKKKKKKTNNVNKYVYLIPALFWMGLIFYMSAMKGESSGSLSLGITKKITDFLEIIRNDSADEAMALTSFLHPIIRKMAHMTEYAILFLLILLAVKHIISDAKQGYQYIFSYVATFAYACSDEIHQLMVSKRAGRITDVIIDCVGALIALLLCVASKNDKWRIIAWFVVALLMAAVFIYLILGNFLR
jgi:VanZ family protein